MNCNLCSFKIADFTNHDDIRVLPQNRSQRFGKTQVNLGIHLGLAHAGQLVFNRVFNRQNILRAGVQPFERGIQRRGLAGACRSGDQNNAVRLQHQAFKTAQHFALHTHSFEVQPVATFVQQTQHCAFAMGAGQGADAHVNCPCADAQADAAILWQTLFSDVQFSHDFQARNQRGMQGAVGLHHIAQRAIDPKANAGMAFVRLDVNITGTVSCRLRQQCVEHADDGRVVRCFQQILNRGQCLHHAGQIDIAFHFTDHGGGAGFALGIGGTDALLQLRGCFGVHLLHGKLAHHLADTGPIDGRIGIKLGLQPEGKSAIVAFFEQQLLAAGEGIGQGITGGMLHGKK